MYGVAQLSHRSVDAWSVKLTILASDDVLQGHSVKPNPCNALFIFLVVTSSFLRFIPYRLVFSYQACVTAWKPETVTCVASKAKENTMILS